MEKVKEQDNLSMVIISLIHYLRAVYYAVILLGKNTCHVYHYERLNLAVRK